MKRPTIHLDSHPEAVVQLALDLIAYDIITDRRSPYFGYHQADEAVLDMMCRIFYYPAGPHDNHVKNECTKTARHLYLQGYRKTTT